MHNTDHPDSPLRPHSPAYYQLVHTLTGHLPAPLDDTPEALAIRNQAAIERVAALLPVGPAEADLAALCVAARAQAEEIMRLLRVHGGDLTTVMQLNKQYVAMVRTSLSAHGHLMRMQALRHKRDATNTAHDADEWTQHIAASTMQQMLDARPQAPVPNAPPASPAPAPVAQLPAPAPAEPPPLRFDAEAAEPGEELDDLEAEAELFATHYRYQAWYIRRHGELPPGCPEGMFDADLVEAIICGDTPALRALDMTDAAAG